MSVLTITNENFEQEVLKSDKPVIVDFWAAWCGPCKMLSPVVDQLAEELEGVKVGKINIDEQMELAEKYNVSSIPCVVAFKNGEEVNRSVGLVPKQKLVDLLK
ncbi:thioredoxin [Eubacterium infirmum F0142]|jgi:thioredoxin|nr:thioredoxin [Eubacterium infirmum F0142]STO01024.1 Thioredoxin C-1 [[Eubacterium] infirmum]